MEEMLFIKDWAKVFWLAEAEKAKEIWWTRFPVSRNGNSYRRLMATRDGHTAFCVFIGIVRLCQRERTHGRVLVKGKPMTALDVAAETGISVKQVEAAIKILTSAEIGWLLPVSRVTRDMVLDSEWPVVNRAATGQEPASDRAVTAIREEKRREEKDNSSNSILSLGATVPAKAPIAAAAAVISPEKVQERAEAIAKRPAWMTDETKAWITPETALELAKLPFTNPQFVAVLKAAKASRKTLSNPAGYVIKQLKRAAGATA